MIHVVVLEARETESIRRAIEAVLAASTRSFKRVAGGVWLVASNHTPRDMLDELTVMARTAGIVVLPVAAEGASRVYGLAASWLANHRADFFR
ncbi:MAG TPA: hypothetical protein VGH28_02145 [Polyangiaceae bacterium]